MSEHSMWHYLYFLVLVKVKDPTEYTGPESYVAQMIKVSSSPHLVPWYIDLKNIFGHVLIIMFIVDVMGLFWCNTFEKLFSHISYYLPQCVKRK